MSLNYSDSEDYQPPSRVKSKVQVKYKQFYRKAWEQIPEFREWLTSIPGERSKAYCKICEKSLHAHRLSLTKHTVSLKHMRLAQVKLSQNFDQENYEEEGDISEGELQYRVDSGAVMDALHGDINRLGHPDAMTHADIVEEITTSQNGDNRLHMYDMASSSHHDDAVSLIKIIPKQKMSSHERVNVITHHLSPSNRASSNSSSNMSSEKPHITTHVLDISKGLPVAGLPVCLYNLVDGRWVLLSESTTNGDGRCMELTGSNGIKPGRYKLHFDTERYFLLRHTPTFYPFVEVVFDICNSTDHNHVPLLLGPFGYTTYKGS